MHIPDGFLSGPVNLGNAAIAAGFLGYSLRHTGKHMEERQVPLLGLTAGFVFAAQMLNFPVMGGTSGHFLGAMLATALMGPFAACVVLSLVLMVQCLGFADGGLTALGSNIFNMGVVGVFSGWLLQQGLLKVLPKSRQGQLTALAVGAWASVMAASGACAAELALSGTSDWGVVLPSMLGVHAVIGVGEALITTAVLGTVMAARPELMGKAFTGGVAQ
jgi:cobalt/nickel transport system permease protein